MTAEIDDLTAQLMASLDRGRALLRDLGYELPARHVLPALRVVGVPDAHGCFIDPHDGRLLVPVEHLAGTHARLTAALVESAERLALLEPR